MHAGLKNVQVIGIGQASLDYLGRVTTFPGEDEKVELADLHRQCGGPASTALATLSRLGIATSFWGSVSDDPFGREIREGLIADGVDATFLRVTPGYTSQFAFIAITKDSGMRTIFWTRGNVPPLKPDEIDLTPYSQAEILHLDGLMIEASMEAARQARDLGLRVVLDAGTMREGSIELIHKVDVLIASEKFAVPLTGNSNSSESALRALSQLGPGEVVITLGSKGSIGLSGKTLFRQRAYPVTAVDTTGAGDVYHGAYIFGMLHNWGMKDCMRFAAAAAAVKCMQIGARKGIPDHAQIQNLISQYPAI